MYSFFIGINSSGGVIAPGKSDSGVKLNVTHSCTLSESLYIISTLLIYQLISVNLYLLRLGDYSYFLAYDVLFQ